MNHTPGPWIAYDMGNGIRITPESVTDDLLPNVSATRNEICLLKPTAGNNEWSDEMWEIQKANAKLIACAPELLEAAEELLVRISGPLNEMAPAIDKLIFAVMKARGKIK